MALTNDIQLTKRNLNCDLMRVICIVFVIMIHTGNPFSRGSISAILFSTIVFLCNGIFFMIGGRFNLSKTFQCKEDYRKYYMGKLITILFPYILVTCLLNLWDTYDSGNWGGIILFFKRTYVAFMHTNYSTHLWFMYPYLGMLLSTPFLSKMLQRISNWELNLLFVIGLVWNIISIYMTRDFDITFSYSEWILSGWCFLFFLGYYCIRIINGSNKIVVYLLGIIGFVVTVVARYLIPGNYKNGVDLAVAFILFTMAVYTFFERELVIKNKLLIKLINLISKYSFIIYLIHYSILTKIAPKIVSTSSVILSFLARAGVTLILSILVAIVLDIFIIMPVQKLMRSILCV